MNIYRAIWRWQGQTHAGFVRADDPAEAWKITREALQPEALLLKITPAYEHMITPQSITINFSNKTDYHLF